MDIKILANINVGYPIYDSKFINKKTLIVTGGGGEGNNGLNNAITVIKCSLTAKDPKLILQKFREIILPENEDSPYCVGVSKNEECEYDIFVGCNQSTRFIKEYNTNNNLRKYFYNSEEHLNFVDAVQMTSPKIDIDEYPKKLEVTQDGKFGCFMILGKHSLLYLFNPTTLKVISCVKGEGSDIVDFSIFSLDGENSVVVSAANSYFIYNDSGQKTFMSSNNKSFSKQLLKFIFFKVFFLDKNKIFFLASGRQKKGVYFLIIDIRVEKIVVSKKIVNSCFNISAFDISKARNLIAYGDTKSSLVFLKLSSLKHVKTFKKLKAFVITSVRFSPNLSSLVVTSASNNVTLLKVTDQKSSKKYFLITVDILFKFFVIVLVSYFVQNYLNGIKFNASGIKKISKFLLDLFIILFKFCYAFLSKYTEKILNNFTENQLEFYKLKAKYILNKFSLIQKVNNIVRNNFNKNLTSSSIKSEFTNHPQINTSIFSVS